MEEAKVFLGVLSAFLLVLGIALGILSACLNQENLLNGCFAALAFAGVCAWLAAGGIEWIKRQS